jgi:hypothetical protein
MPQVFTWGTTDWSGGNSWIPNGVSILQTIKNGITIWKWVTISYLFRERRKV